MPDALANLTARIQQGRSADETQLKPAIEALIAERYHKAVLKNLQIRNAYGLARDETEGGVPYAGLIHPDNPTAGPYGGTSLVWFPGEGCSLMGFGIGTRGISPDEGILTPGSPETCGRTSKVLRTPCHPSMVEARPSCVGS